MASRCVLVVVALSLILYLLYSSKDLGALYNEDKGHLGEMVQQASVLKLVVSWLKKANTMVIDIMC